MNGRNVPPVDPLRDPKELGRRISAARGYAQLKKTEFAKLMVTSVPTVNRWEDGEVGSIGTAVVMRQQLAERIQKATNCPPSLLGLQLDFTLGEDEDSLEDSLDQIRQSIGALAVLVTTKDMPDAARALLEDELSVALKWSSNAPNSEEPGNAAQNV